MNRSLAIALLGVGLIVAGMVRADAAGGPASTKVGYVDLQRTLMETSVGKSAKARLEGDQKKKQAELDRKQKELQAFAAELDKQRSVLKPEVLRQRETELQQRLVQLNDLYMKLQQELAKQEAQLVRDIFDKASPIIADIGQRDGYTILLEKNESAVLWAAPSTDITAEVNKRLDAGGSSAPKGGAPKGGAPAAPSAPK
jgi:outer membrane protein